MNIENWQTTLQPFYEELDLQNVELSYIPMAANVDGSIGYQGGKYYVYLNSINAGNWTENYTWWVLCHELTHVVQSVKEGWSFFDVDYYRKTDFFEEWADRRANRTIKSLGITNERYAVLF